MQLIEDSGRAVTQAVPLIGFAEAGAGGYFDDGGFPVGRAGTRSPSRRSMTSMPMRWKSPANSMMPAYRDGDVIVVSPAAPIRRGDRVVVKTKDGEVIVKELKRRTSKTIELRSLNPAHKERTLPVRDVLWIARIVWASQ